MEGLKEIYLIVKRAVSERLILKMSAILGLGVIVITAIAFLTLYVFITNLNSAGLSDLQEKGLSVSESVKEEGRLGIMKKNSFFLEKTVKDYISDPEIAYIAFADPEGNHYYSAGEDYIEFQSGLPPLPKEGDTISGLAISDVDSGYKVLDVVRKVSYTYTNDNDEDVLGVLGYVRVGVSTRNLYDMTAPVWWLGVVVSALVLAMAVAVIYFMHRVVVGPVVQMAGAAKEIGEGDLSTRVYIESADEVGILASSLNEMAENIKEQMKRSGFLLENIAETVELIGQTSTDIFSISAQQSSGATEQAASVYEVSSTSKEIAASATRIADTAEDVASHARKTTEASEQGRVEISEAVHQVRDATQRVDEVANRIVELGEKSQKISGIIDIINEISEQTNLLSLNAAIEASGAGEAGKRFQVVAQEIRRLAGRTMDSTKVVRGLIEEIQSATNTSVMVTEQAMKSTREAADIIERLNQSFQNILELVDQTTKASTEITLSTRQQTTACEQMVSTIMEVSEVAAEVEKGAKETEKAVVKLRELSDTLSGIASPGDDM